MVDVKRVFVGGLTPEITVDELKERFQKFCEVLDVQIKKKRDCESTPEKYFAYLNVKSTPENLQKCFSLYNKTKWKGAELRLQFAKENFLTRLEMERKDGFDVKRKTTFDNKDSIEYHNPFENLPDPSTHEMRGCVPGTLVPGEKNWVVGKYGRVLPVVFVRNKDKKKIVRVDPSKFCHNVKRIKEDDSTQSPNHNNMTLHLDEKDSDIVRKRKGEFPEWKPSPSKRKNIDFEKLRELYMNNNSVQNCNNVSKEPDFEIVSRDISLSQVSKTFESHSDSDSDSYYASLKNPKSKSFPKKIKLTRPVVQSVSISASESVSNVSHGDIDISVIKGDKVFDRNNKKGSADTTVLKASISQQDVNNASRNKKPKIKPFGGTKILYETAASRNTNLSSEKETEKSCTFVTAQLPSAKVKLNDEQKLQTHSKILSDINSKDKTVVTANKICNSINVKKVKEVPQHVNKMTGPLSKYSEDQDGNDSASSADTDEIINRSKSATPSKTSNDFQNSFTEARSKMNSGLNLSIINEFSSGLVKGEIPMVNESSCDNSADDSDENDFEKFALRESQRVKHMKEKELSRTLQNDTLFKINRLKNINDKTVLRKESSNNLLLGNGDDRNSASNESEVDSNESVVDSNESVVDSNESVVDSNESEVDSNESVVDSNESVVDSNESVVDSNGSEVDSSESVVDSNGSEVDSSENEVDSSDNVVDSNENEVDSSDNVVDSNESEVDSNENEVDSNENEVNSSNSAVEIDENDVRKNVEFDKTVSDSSSIERDLDNSGSDSDTGGNDSDDENDSESSESCFNTDGNNSDSSGNDSDDENSDLNIKSDINNCVKKQLKRDEKSQKKESLQPEKVTVEANKKALAKDNAKLTKEIQQLPESTTPNKKAKKEGKQDMDTNKKRLESVKQRQMENQAQKSAITKALANIDNTSKPNKKILFDETDSDDVSSSNVNKTEDDSDKDTSSSDEEIAQNKNKEKNVPGLFDSSENEASDHDTDMFKIRPEFEGRSGQRRMELQSRYGNDDRFKLDTRFIDSEDDDDDDDDEEMEIPSEDDEKTKSLKILEEVIGTKINTGKKGKMFRDVSALHFDPTREDHTQFEVKAKEPTKKEKISKKKKIATKETEEDKTDELPEVGKDKFFEVSDSLTDTFKNASQTTDKGFSLLSAFGSHGSESENDDKEEGVKILKHKSDMFPWQQKFDDDDSDSDMNDNNEDLENTQSDVDEGKTQKEAVVFSSTKSFFFFQENDDRITEGIKNFCRRESLEDTREKWLERRPYLVEAYRTKHKRLLRKTKMDKKQSNRPVTPRRH